MTEELSAYSDVVPLAVKYLEEVYAQDPGFEKYGDPERRLLFAYAGFRPYVNRLEEEMQDDEETKWLVWLVSTCMMLQFCVPNNERRAARALYKQLNSIQLRNPVSWAKATENVANYMQNGGDLEGVD